MSPYALTAPQMTDSPWVVAVVFYFILITVFSVGPRGVLREQAHWLLDTRRSRTFDIPSLGASILRPCLFVQTFLFEGLCLYVAVEPEPVAAAGHIAPAALPTLLTCLWLPVAWFLFQWCCFQWAGYLARADEERHILNRVFVAAHLLVGPWMLLLFLLQMTHHVERPAGTILLCILFFLSQMAFIFNGIKIFFGGILSSCFIILYLCALEIAPLYILVQKLAS